MRRIFKEMKVDYLFFLVVLLFSCSDKDSGKKQKLKSNRPLARYQINVDTDSTSLVKSSKLFKSISYLKLETKDGAFIGNIDRLLFDSDKIFIADKNIAQAIFIFNNEGKLISKIDEKGKGPGEYLGIRDITLDTKKKRICLLDLAGRKVNFYSYSGDFLESKTIPFLFSSFVYIDTSALAFDLRTATNRDKTEINNYYMVTADFAGNVFNKAFHYDDAERNFTYWSPIHLRSFGEKVLFHPRYSSTIYQVQKNNVKPYFSLNFNGKGFPKENQPIISDTDFLELSKNYSYFRGEYADLDQLSCFAINTPQGNFNLIYSKRNQKSVLIRPLLIESFLSNFFHPPFNKYRNNTVVTFAQAHQIIQLKATYPPDELEENLDQELFNNLNENDNPVLFFYDLYEI